MRPKGLEIIEMQCDSKKSWRLTLKGDVNISIGRDLVMEKMRRFVTVYDAELHQLWSDIKSIDVRYSNGIAV
ncbi:MAG: cell division protein FtsQ/DivIB, partial [Flammeovirgaceae bacterium]